ncbi:hypothetical protein CRG98_020712 [Punica granatum]|uniref:Uncharacterized protein n=1 Tax=Punica granatum TaxID=22663 RepID=A0A2I0JU17_PUNGR|nr:hypothetical protein CRG98_020712 [Punica granatum]
MESEGLKSLLSIYFFSHFFIQQARGRAHITSRPTSVQRLGDVSTRHSSLCGGACGSTRGLVSGGIRVNLEVLAMTNVAVINEDVVTIRIGPWGEGVVAGGGGRVVVEELGSGGPAGVGEGGR